MCHTLKIYSMFLAKFIYVRALQERMQLDLVHRRDDFGLRVEKLLEMVNAIVTYATTLHFPSGDGFLNGLPRFKPSRRPSKGRMNEVQIDVIMTPFGERCIDCGFRFLVSMIR